MSQQELLKFVIGRLDDLGIDHMLTGSLVSSLQGEPRLTHDIDLVVSLTNESADRFFSVVDPALFYLSRAAMAEAIDHGRMFNLLELASGDKVDLWMLTDDPFDHSRFARKQSLELFGVRINISTPEDTILAKLRWAKESGGSEKQLNDVRGVYELQRAALDCEYIERWALSMGLTPLWDRIVSESETD